MAGTFAVNLAKPIKSVKIVNSNGDCTMSPACNMNPGIHAEQIKLTEELKTQQKEFEELCKILHGLIDKINYFYEQIFAGQKDEIAGLSVEIARKILMRRVEYGDYEIESIIKEALKNAPVDKDMIVHLNPEDFALCQKGQQDGSNGTFAGLKLVADPNIGLAECMLESPKGIIKSLIKEHLEQIGKALEKAE